MTTRQKLAEWLADLITGGALSEARRQRDNNHQAAMRRGNEASKAKMALIDIFKMCTKMQRPSKDSIAEIAREGLR